MVVIDKDLKWIYQNRIDCNDLTNSLKFIGTLTASETLPAVLCQTSITIKLLHILTNSDLDKRSRKICLNENCGFAEFQIVCVLG